MSLEDLKGYTKNLLQCQTDRHTLNRKLVRQVRSGEVNLQPKEREPRLPEETRKRIREFFLDPANVRISPRANDSISVKNQDGIREKRPRHLLNSTLHEAHEKYLQENPNHPISRSQFCKERPGEVVLMGCAGSHTTCTCIKCRNPEMMVSTSELSDLEDFKSLIKTTDEARTQVTIDSLLSRVTCESESCQLGLEDCEECGEEMGNLKKDLNSIFDKNEIKTVKYQQWMFTDKEQKQEITADAKEYTDELTNNLAGYRTHKYLERKQIPYIKTLRTSLPDDEIMVSMDYAENYTVVHQNEVQQAYFRNTQVSMLGAAVRYKKNEEIKHQSFVILSNNTKHETSNVYTGYKKIQNWIKSEVPGVRHTHIISDGCASQFKNRYQFANVANHAEDFGHTASWHFTPTGHGKSEVDGINGVLKKQAKEESLRLGDNNYITSAEGFKTFIETHKTSTKDGRFKAIPFLSTPEDLEETNKNSTLKQRWANAQQIKGTQKFHCFEVDKTSTKHLFVRYFSSSDEFKRVKISK